MDHVTHHMTLLFSGLVTLLDEYRYTLMPPFKMLQLYECIHGLVYLSLPKWVEV